MGSSCSVSPLKKSKSTDQRIQQFNLLAVRFSRPDFAVPELDDFSSTNRQLACSTPHALWSTLLEDSSAKPLIACINSIGRTKVETAHYLYVSKAMPYLEPNAAEKEGPPCLYRLLPKIILPREVYFLAKATDQVDQQCYAMSFDSKANQLFDAELRAPRFEVDFHFPLLRKLQSSQDLEIWLLVSVLSLFEEEKAYRASIVPEVLEQKCFASDPLFPDKRSGKIPGVFWP